MKTNLSRILIVSAFFHALAASTLAAPGGLDTAFGTGGKVNTFFGDATVNARSAVTIQPDGKILVAGETISNNSAPNPSNFGLLRYNSDGSLDATLNGTGGVITDVGGLNDYGRCVALQLDGKIVVAGDSYNVNGGSRFAVVRYNADGSLDTTFNGTGKAIASGGFDNAYGVVVQPDGKILVAGTSSNSFAVMRWHGNISTGTPGTLDTSFGGTGKVTTSVGTAGFAEGYSVALQKDGKILVAGKASNGTNYDFAVVRYNTNGSMDPTFNGTGMVTTPVSSGGAATGDDEARSVVVQSDGKIVVGGNAYIVSDNDFALVRYNIDGSLDTTFNGTGKLTTDFAPSYDFGQSLALQGDGKILIAGYSNNNFALARYNANGSLDTTFDADGKVATDFGSSDVGTGVALQADGKIVVAGYSNNTGPNHFAVARYQTGPVVPKLYVGSMGGPGQVGMYNPSTGAAINAIFASGLSPFGLLLSGNTLYVADTLNRVTAYNINTGTAITSFGNAGSISGLSSPRGLALAGNTLYVANNGNNSVTTYNATTGAALGLTINTGSGPYGIAVGNNTLYVANNTSGTVTGFNATTGVSTGFSVAVTGPLGLAVANNYLYVGSASSAVSKYNAVTGATVAFTTPISGGIPSALAISGNNLYVAFQGSNSVSEFNASSGAAVTSFGTSGSISVTGPTSLAVTQTTPRDLNGDGNGDIIFQDGIGQIFAWFLDGSGNAVNFTTGSGLTSGSKQISAYNLGNWQVVGVGDVNGDGIADIIFQDGASQIFAWFLDGSGNAVNFTTGSGLTPGSKQISAYNLGTWRVVGVGDLNGDGIADIIFQDGASQIFAWFLDGSGNAVNFTTGSGLKPGSKQISAYNLGNWRVVGVSDVNGDGIADIFFQDGASQIFAWFLDGSGNAVNFTTGSGIKPGSKQISAYNLGSWRVVGMSDLNGDGIADIIFQDAVSQIFAWFLDGSGNAVNFTTGSGLKPGSKQISGYNLGNWRMY